jgi:hypothetical protein
VDIVTNGDILTLSVSNNNGSLLSTDIVGNILTITYLGNQSGNAEVTVTATDLAGASVSDTFNVLVNPANHDPVAICQDVTLILNEDGIAELDPAQVNNGSYDVDEGDVLSFSVSQTVFTCDDVGAQTVTLVVVDQAFASSSCEATVNVLIPLTVIASSIQMEKCFR